MDKQSAKSCKKVNEKEKKYSITPYAYLTYCTSGTQLLVTHSIKRNMSQQQIKSIYRLLYYKETSYYSSLAMSYL